MRIKIAGGAIHLCPSSGVTSAGEAGFIGTTICGRQVVGYNADASDSFAGDTVCRRCERLRPQAEANAKAFDREFIIEEAGRMS